MGEAPSWRDTAESAIVTTVAGGAIQVLWDDMRARQRDKAGQTIASIIRLTGEPALNQRLERSPVIEAMFVNAVDAAIRTGLEAKRRLLARAVAEAVRDDAKIDASHLLTDVLSQLDVPHARTLKALADEWEYKQQHWKDDETNGWGHSKVWGAAPAPIRATLVRTGTAIPVSNMSMSKAEPHRSQGISDYGLEVVAQLIAEGLAIEPI